MLRGSSQDLEMASYDGQSCFPVSFLNLKTCVLIDSTASMHYAIYAMHDGFIRICPVKKYCASGYFQREPNV